MCCLCKGFENFVQMQKGILRGKNFVDNVAENYIQHFFFLSAFSILTQWYLRKQQQTINLLLNVNRKEWGVFMTTVNVVKPTFMDLSSFVKLLL